MTNQTPLPQAVEPGNELHLSLLMAPHGLNFVVGADRKALLSYAADVWAAARKGLVPATPAQAAPEAVSRHAPQARALLDIAQYLAGHLQMVQDRIDAALATPSAVPSPSAAEDAMDAKRYRWLLSFGNALYVEWRHDCAHGPTALNAAIDAALSTGPQKAKGPGAHTEASEAGQEPPTHAGSVAPGEGL
jgi:hypothetical protein